MMRRTYTLMQQVLRKSKVVHVEPPHDDCPQICGQSILYNLDVFFPQDKFYLSESLNNWFQEARRYPKSFQASPSILPAYKPFFILVLLICLSASNLQGPRCTRYCSFSWLQEPLLELPLRLIASKQGIQALMLSMVMSTHFAYGIYRIRFP